MFYCDLFQFLALRSPVWRWPNDGEFATRPAGWPPGTEHQPNPLTPVRVQQN